MQIVAASDYAELEAEVSGTVVNRITFDGDRIAQVSGGLAGRAGEKSNLHTNDLDPRRTRQGQVLLFSGLAAVGLRSNAESDRALDKVDRRFSAEGPDRLWVADITYVPTWAGFLYLAIVLDVWSRRIVGWAMAHHLKTALVLDALEMALSQRCPESVSHHSDRGCQYTSYAFGKRCREAGVVPSMESTGDAYDNAMAESFFATLEREVIDHRRFNSPAEARMAIFTWLEGWYNPHRRHSALGYLSPINYERKMLSRAA